MDRANYIVRSLCNIRWHAVRLYRLAHRLHTGGHYSLAAIVFTANRLLTGVEIHPAAVFGDGLRIAHANGIVVHLGTRVGRDCCLFHQVTIGVRNATGEEAAMIGDRVTIYPGAKILGPVTIGDDAVIGANALVIQDVPAGSRVKAAPALIA